MHDTELVVAAGHAGLEPGGCGPGRSGWCSRVAVLAVPALLAAAPVWAQETGVVRGTVTLVENGGFVDGAVILILGTGACSSSRTASAPATSPPPRITTE